MKDKDEKKWIRKIRAYDRKQERIFQKAQRACNRKDERTLRSMLDEFIKTGHIK